LSDQWEFFPCTMGEDQAFISVDVGIKESVHQAPKSLCKVRLKYRHLHPSGLPTDKDFKPAKVVEDALEAFALAAKDWYVGRVTVGGHRYFYFYTSQKEPAWVRAVEKLSASSGFVLSVDYAVDAEHAMYFRELYPTTDDWQVIKDMRVIDAAKTRGDSGTVERQIDHWTYFDNETSARPFIEWAEKNGFVHDAKYPSIGEDGKYCVRLHHRGTLELRELTHQTIQLNRKAEELGGDYDGWETPVER
jgi:hypothetical protein